MFQARPSIFHFDSMGSQRIQGRVFQVSLYGGHREKNKNVKRRTEWK